MKMGGEKQNLLKYNLMSNIYKWYIILKYNYYKLYWKFHKPRKPSSFYKWIEYYYSVLDQKAVCLGVLDDKSE